MFGLASASAPTIAAPCSHPNLKPAMTLELTTRVTGGMVPLAVIHTPTRTGGIPMVHCSRRGAFRPN